MARHNVVIPTEDGGVSVYPMKEWLRQHLEHLPAGLDGTNSTSHQLRDGLRRMGWTVEMGADEVRLMLPGSKLQPAIDSILGNDTDSPDVDVVTPSFELEYQLRDFISHNLAAMTVDGHQLRLYVDPTGRDGIEFPTPVGFIDILAVTIQMRLLCLS